MSALVGPGRRGATPDEIAASARWFAAAGRATVTALIFVSVGLIFLVSDMLLAKHGFNYGEVGGTPLEKVHPGTWVALLALILIGARRGNPLVVIDMFFSQAGLAIFFAGWVALLAYAILVTRAPFTPLIDTFFLPMALFLLVGVLDERGLRRMALMLHALLVSNALIGVYEYVSGNRLTPFLIGGAEMLQDWRATALLGHPLGNAAIVGSYIVTLAAGGGRDLPRLLRPAIIGVCLVSMTAFGGRSSLVAALLMLTLAGAGRAIFVLRGGGVDKLTSAVAFLCAPLAAVVVYLIAQTGFFDQFIDRFSNDAGSAKARVIMFRLFEILSWDDLLFGPNQSYLASVQALEGIEFGIENFWIGFMMSHGIVMSVFFFLALFAFCGQLVARTRPTAILPLMFYFIVATSAVSMSAKTTIFGMFVVIVMTMLRPAGARSAT